MKSSITTYPLILNSIFWVVILIQFKEIDDLFINVLFLFFLTTLLILIFDFKYFCFDSDSISVVYPFRFKRLLYYKEDIEYVEFKKRHGSGQMTQIQIKLKNKRIFFFNRKYYFLVWSDKKFFDYFQWILKKNYNFKLSIDKHYKVYENFDELLKGGNL